MMGKEEREPLEENLNRAVEIGGKRYRKKSGPRRKDGGGRRVDWDVDVLPVSAEELHGTEAAVSAFATKVAANQAAARRRIKRNANRRIAVVDAAMEIVAGEGRDALQEQQKSVERSYRTSQGAKSTGALPAAEVLVTGIVETAKNEKAVKRGLAEARQKLLEYKETAGAVLGRDDHRVKSKVGVEAREKSRARRNAGQTKTKGLGPKKNRGLVHGAGEGDGKTLRLRGGCPTPESDFSEDEGDWDEVFTFDMDTEEDGWAESAEAAAADVEEDRSWRAFASRLEAQESRIVVDAGREVAETLERDGVEAEEMEEERGASMWEHEEWYEDPLLPQTPEADVDENVFREMLAQSLMRMWTPTGAAARDAAGLAVMVDQAVEAGMRAGLHMRGRAIRPRHLAEGRLPGLEEEPDIDAI